MSISDEFFNLEKNHFLKIKYAQNLNIYLLFRRYKLFQIESIKWLKVLLWPRFHRF